jgi:hypothetical protein
MDGAEVRQGVHFQQEASRATGGQAFQGRKIEESVPLLLNAIRGQWALGLVPPQALDQKMHSLAIKSPEKNVQISAPAKILLQ